MEKRHILYIVLCIVLAVGGFAAGTFTVQSRNKTRVTGADSEAISELDNAIGELVSEQQGERGLSDEARDNNTELERKTREEGSLIEQIAAELFNSTDGSKAARAGLIECPATE